ncbi:MAG: DUF3810 domain-containing protein [Acidobacteria bacterium]|nr:DUF3810 domain-containing protein [Acidobacteriota bacterium]
MENSKTKTTKQNKITSIIALSKWISSLSILLFSICLQTLSSFYPQKVELYYSRKIYPYIGQILSLFNKLIWFSIAELLLLLLSISIIIWLGYQIKAFYQKRQEAKEFFVKTFWRFTTILNIGLLFFLLLWGLNYQKQPLRENLKLIPREPSSVELIEVCKEFIIATNESYNESYKEALETKYYLTNSEQNNLFNTQVQHSKLPIDWITLNNKIEESFQKEVLLKELTYGNYGPAKAVYFSNLMSHFGISGIFIPLTGEPNVNVAQTDVAIPFTLAHEKAHQRGFALEDEANFIAFLICSKSENPYIRYSGYLMASTYLLSNLASVEPEKYKDIYKMFNLGPKTDLKAMYSFWSKYEGTLSKASETVNNSYLKANRVQSGIKNYNEVVELIINYYFTYLYRNNTDIEHINTSNKS